VAQHRDLDVLGVWPLANLQHAEQVPQHEQAQRAYHYAHIFVAGQPLGGAAVTGSSLSTGQHRSRPRREVPTHRSISQSEVVETAASSLLAARTLTLHPTGLGKRMTLHGLRHSMLTHLASEGIDLGALNLMAGHKRILTTYDIYVHATNKHHPAVRELIEPFAATPHSS
jgi:hypothetical protein